MLRSCGDFVCSTIYDMYMPRESDFEVNEQADDEAISSETRTMKSHFISYPQQYSKYLKKRDRRECFSLIEFWKSMWLEKVFPILFFSHICMPILCSFNVAVARRIERKRLTVMTHDNRRRDLKVRRRLSIIMTGEMDRQLHFISLPLHADFFFVSSF